MNFYDVARHLYLETNASGIGLETRLLHVMDDRNCGCDEIPDNAIFHPTAFTSNSLSNVEWHYSNMECEALGILNGLEKFHHYCFVREVCIVTDHKPLVGILSKDVAMLSKWLQCIQLRIHQYRV